MPDGRDTVEGGVVAVFDDVLRDFTTTLVVIGPRLFAVNVRPRSVIQALGNPHESVDHSGEKIVAEDPGNAR
jgi:hypothetical protein